VRQEVIVAPMRDYVENWLKQALIKITEENQEVAVITDPRTQLRRIQKEHW
jgi:hypothetical protein